MPANDPLKLENQIIIIKIILYHSFFVKYLWISRVSSTSIFPKPTKRSYSYLFIPVCFISVACRLSSAGNVALSNEIPYLE